MNSQVQPAGHIQTRLGTPLDHRRVAYFCRRHHIARLSVIHKVEPGGSGTSDCNMLVEFDAGKAPSRFELVAMEIELGNMVERRIDLKTMDQLRAKTSSVLLDAAVPVFES